MLRHVQASADGEWSFVSGKQPCHICGGHEGCRRGFEGQFASCVRVSSDWPLTTGGWVHRMNLTAAVAERVAPMHRIVRHHQPGVATRDEAQDTVSVAS